MNATHCIPYDEGCDRCNPPRHINPNEDEPVTPDSAGVSPEMKNLVGAFERAAIANNVQDNLHEADQEPLDNEHTDAFRQLTAAISLLERKARAFGWIEQTNSEGGQGYLSCTHAEGQLVWGPGWNHPQPFTMLEAVEAAASSVRGEK